MVIDCDMHVIEPNEVWRGLAEFRGLVGKIGDTFVPELGANIAERVFDINTRDPNEKLGWHHEEALHVERIDKAMILPTRAYYIAGACVGQTEAQLVQYYNEWILREVPLPHIPVGLLSMNEKNVEDLIDMGFKAVTVLPNPRFNRPLHHESNMWVWKKLADAGIPVIVHTIACTSLSNAGADWCRESLAVEHVVSHLHLTQLAVTSFCALGILREAPELRVAFAEGKSWWLKKWLYAIGDEACEAFYNNCFIMLEPGEIVAPFYERCYIYGSDYPHFDSHYPNSRAITESRLSDKHRGMVFDENPRRFIG